MEILLDALRDSVAFKESLADQFEGCGIDFDLLRNDPTFEAGLRIARMYIKDEGLLDWWLNESLYDGYSSEDGDFVFPCTSQELIDYYKSKKNK